MPVLQVGREGGAGRQGRGSWQWGLNGAGFEGGKGTRDGATGTGTGVVPVGSEQCWCCRLEWTRGGATRTWGPGGQGGGNVFWNLGAKRCWCQGWERPQRRGAGKGRGAGGGNWRLGFQPARVS